MSESERLPIQPVRRARPEDVAGRPSGKLLDADTSERFRRRWSEIQTGFVDEPRQAVDQADVLVGDVMDHIYKVFATSRQELGRQSSADGTTSTEELRRTLQGYRSFLDRLLSL